MATSDLTKRVAVAAVGIPATVALIYGGGLWLGVALAAVAALSALELYRLMGARGLEPFANAGAAAAAAMLLVAGARPSPAATAPTLWTLLVVLFLGTAAAAVWLRGPHGKPLSAATATVGGSVYTGGTLVFALFLRHLPIEGPPRDRVTAALAGAALVAYPIALTWINDSIAYFAGRRWGRRKLSPVISPGKTVEGAAAALVGTIAIGALYAAFVLRAWLGVELGVVAGAVGGALVSVTAQVGDLAESLFKREAGVKDSGTLLPGHGGVLDRFDALFFTLPVAYWFLWTTLAPSTGLGMWRG